MLTQPISDNIDTFIIKEQARQETFTLLSHRTIINSFQAYSLPHFTPSLF